MEGRINRLKLLCARPTVAGRRRFFPLFLSVVLLFAAAGCEGEKAAKTVKGADRSGGVLNYYLGEPVAIDPAYVQEVQGIEVAKQLFDGLVDYDPRTLALKPAVAVRWRANQAGDTWTFWLRRGVKFHNGREVTAADFAFAWDRVAAKKTASEVAYHLAPIKGFAAVQKGRAAHLSGVDVSGKYVLKINLNHPFADFPIVLGHPVFSPVPKEAVAKGKAGFADRPVGNGPFQMDGDWRHEESIALKAFAGYYGAKPWLDGVNFKLIDNAQTAFLEFNGGALDVAAVPPGQVKATVTQFGAGAVVGRPQLALQFFGFNLRKAPFKNNTKLRQAINYAIDRKAIASNVYEDAYVAAGSIVPPVLAGYKPPAEKYGYAPNRAKRLLKEAGFPGGRGLPVIKLLYNTGQGNEGPAQVIQENLADIGVESRLEGLEFGAFLSALRAGKMSMFAANWQADYPSADTFLYALFHSESSDNVLGFADPKVDDLLLRARQAVEPGERSKLYGDAEARILRAAPIAPIVYAGSRAVHNSKVKGFTRTALDDTPLDRVWLSNQ